MVSLMLNAVFDFSMSKLIPGQRPHEQLFLYPPVASEGV
jgi:hypothetical protein